VRLAVVLFLSTFSFLSNQVGSVSLETRIDWFYDLFFPNLTRARDGHGEVTFARRLSPATVHIPLEDTLARAGSSAPASGRNKSLFVTAGRSLARPDSLGFFFFHTLFLGSIDPCPRKGERKEENPTVCAIGQKLVAKRPKRETSPRP